MMQEYAKALAAYSVTYLMGWLGSRYHLNAEQMSYVMADVTAVGAGLYGIYAHGQAAKMAPPNGGTK